MYTLGRTNIANAIHQTVRTSKAALAVSLATFVVGSNGKSSNSVQDFAMAMIDELENPAHTRQRFTVGY
jgi:putative NADH-flavin reductase